MDKRASRIELKKTRVDTGGLAFEEWYDKHHAKYRNLAGIRRHLNDHYGKGEWGDDEFDQYMHELYGRAVEQSEAAERAERPPKEFPIAEEGATFDERVQAYIDYFENPSPNDLVMIRTMVSIEMAIENANQQYVAALSADSVSRSAAKGWSDIVRQMSREHRLIQETLGIGRAKREKEDKDVDQVEYVRSVMRRATSFVKEHSIPIRCPYCTGEEAEVEINMGFILFHFRQDVPWRFEYQCPRCGESIVLPAP